MSQSCDTENIVENPRTDDVIQHNNNMLVLWQAHVLHSRLVVCYGVLEH